MLLIDAGQIQVWRDTVDDPAFLARNGALQPATMPAAPPTTPPSPTPRSNYRRSGPTSCASPGIKLVADGSIQGLDRGDADHPGYYTGGTTVLLSPRISAVRAGARKLNAWTTAEQRHRPGLRRRHRRMGAARWTPGLIARRRGTPRPRPPGVPWMDRLGICANIFTNHIWYWGDQGCDRADHGPRETESAA